MRSWSSLITGKLKRVLYLPSSYILVNNVTPALGDHDDQLVAWSSVFLQSYNLVRTIAQLFSLPLCTWPAYRKPLTKLTSCYMSTLPKKNFYLAPDIGVLLK
jgi:hypothetical protein